MHPFPLSLISVLFSKGRSLSTLLVMIEMLSSHLKNIKKNTLWSCQKVCETLTFLLDNIYIRFGTKLYRQIVGIPMGTNFAPLVSDLLLFCDFMLSLSGDKDAEVIEAFNSTSRYLDDLLNIDNTYFDGIVNQIYQSKLQLNKIKQIHPKPRPRF